MQTEKMFTEEKGNRSDTEKNIGKGVEFWLSPFRFLFIQEGKMIYSGVVYTMKDILNFICFMHIFENILIARSKCMIVPNLNGAN